MKKVFVIGHSKGGTGKSLLAFNLAHSLAEVGKVTVMDLDPQRTIYLLNTIKKDLEVKTPDSVEEIIDIITGEGEFLVVDTGGFDNDKNRIAFSYADEIIVPISNTATEIFGFEVFKRILKEEEITGNVKLLLNKIHPLAKNLDDIKEAIDTGLDNVTILKNIIRERVSYDRSLQKGESILSSNDLKAQKEIRDLRDGLI